MMKKKPFRYFSGYAFIIIVCLLFKSVVLSAQEAINPLRPLNYPYISDVPNLDSLRMARLKNKDRADWWRNARFGMFVHWGVSSTLGGIYNGKVYPGYSEHIQRVAKIPVSDYRRVVTGTFNPILFNADTWVRLAYESGMRYFIVTAKHHDGVAMYQSDVNDNNIVSASPWKHDPMPELRKACKKYGMKFGFYYSQAFDWGEENGSGNDWDYSNPGGDRLLHGMQWWVNYPVFLTKTREYVDKKAIPQVLELIQKYEPDILWFDTPHKIPDEENLRILAAIRNADPDIVVNGRLFDHPMYFDLVDYINSGDKPSEFVPQKYDWEGLPTTNNSYGYSQQDRTHKPATHFIRLIAKASSLGGNILLNMGPKGDGTVDSADVAIFEGIGKWMGVNAKSIRGTSAGILPQQSWGVSTTGKHTVYLHVFDWPSDRKLLISGLKSNPSSVHILGKDQYKLNVKRINEFNIELSGLPSEMPDTANTVIKLTFLKNPKADTSIYVDSEKSTSLYSISAKIKGGIRYRAGRNAGDLWIANWKTKEDTAKWQIRTNRETRFIAELIYDVPEPIKSQRAVEGDAGKELVSLIMASGGTYYFKINQQAVERKVGSGRQVKDMIGPFVLPKGKSEIVIHSKEITGDELFRIRRLVLKPQ